MSSWLGAPRPPGKVPSVGDRCPGFVLVAFAIYGLLAPFGDDGLGPGFGRPDLAPDVVASVDQFRHRSAGEVGSRETSRPPDDLLTA